MAEGRGTGEKDRLVNRKSARVYKRANKEQQGNSSSLTSGRHSALHIQTTETSVAPEWIPWMNDIIIQARAAHECLQLLEQRTSAQAKFSGTSRRRRATPKRFG